MIEKELKNGILLYDSFYNSYYLVVGITERHIRLVKVFDSFHRERRVMLEYVVTYDYDSMRARRVA